MKNRKVLIIGGGGREHALCWKLSQSPRVKELHCIPGNAGMEEIAICNADISMLDFPSIKNYALSHHLDLIVVGPEQPLVAGIKDFFRDSTIEVFGPDKLSAQLEGSKIFTKNFFSKYNIPTPGYKTFFTLDDALYHIRTTHHYPIVIKADGLAAGKGVVIADNEEHAVTSIKEMMEFKKFKSAGDKIVIEEYVAGNELSYQIILCGNQYSELKPSQDFKKALEGNLGSNTGGMGNLCPPSWSNENVLKQIKDTIVQPVVQNLVREGMHFCGVLFTGMIMSGNEPKALEINVRFGDPEIQTVLPLLKTDLLDVIEACLSSELDQLKLDWADQYSACVVLTSQGYPDDDYLTGFPIKGLDKVKSMENVVLFHAGTKKINNTLVNHGGRVLNVVGIGKSSQEAAMRAYDAVNHIHFKGMTYRKDIS